MAELATACWSGIVILCALSCCATWTGRPKALVTYEAGISDMAEEGAKKELDVVIPLIEVENKLLINSVINVWIINWSVKIIFDVIRKSRLKNSNSVKESKYLSG